MNSDIFEKDIQYVPPKEKIDIIKKMSDELQKIRQNLDTLRVDTPERIEAYWQAVQSLYMAYQNQISEVEVDIIAIFKDMPEFAEMFRDTKWVTDEDKKESPKMKFYRLHRKDLSEYITDKRRLLEYEAKLLSLNTFLRDIFYEALQKMIGNIRSRGPIVIEKPVDWKYEGGVKGRLWAIEVLVNKESRLVVAQRYRTKTENVRKACEYWSPKLKAEGLIPSIAMIDSSSKEPEKTLENPPISTEKPEEKPV